jgi:hypothetical protein
MSKISPWMPEQDRTRLAALGKLIEECNETAARAARCIIHGLDERDPDTGRLNSEELTREISDLEACLVILQEKTGVGLDTDRCEEKLIGFHDWHRKIRAREERTNA